MVQKPTVDPSDLASLHVIRDLHPEPQEPASIIPERELPRKLALTPLQVKDALRNINEDSAAGPDLMSVRWISLIATSQHRVSADFSSFQLLTDTVNKLAAGDFRRMSPISSPPLSLLLFIRAKEISGISPLHDRDKCLQ